MPYAVYLCEPKVVEGRKYFVPKGTLVAYCTSEEACDAAIRLLWATPPGPPVNAYRVSAFDVFAARGILR